MKKNQPTNTKEVPPQMGGVVVISALKTGQIAHFRRQIVHFSHQTDLYNGYYQ